MVSGENSQGGGNSTPVMPRFIDFVYQSTLGWRVIINKKMTSVSGHPPPDGSERAQERERGSALNRRGRAPQTRKQGHAEGRGTIKPHREGTLNPRGLNPHREGTLHPKLLNPNREGTLNPRRLKPHREGTPNPRGLNPHREGTLHPKGLNPNREDTLNPSGLNPHREGTLNRQVGVGCLNEPQMGGHPK